MGIVQLLKKEEDFFQFILHVVLKSPFKPMNSVLFVCLDGLEGLGECICSLFIPGMGDFQWLNGSRASSPAFFFPALQYLGGKGS